MRKTVKEWIGGLLGGQDECVEAINVLTDAATKQRERLDRIETTVYGPLRADGKIRCRSQGMLGKDDEVAALARDTADRLTRLEEIVQQVIDDAISKAVRQRIDGDNSSTFFRRLINKPDDDVPF